MSRRMSCEYCVYCHVAGIQNCPARDCECHACSWKGHFVKSPKCMKRRVATIDEENDHEDAGLYVKTVTQVDNVAKSMETQFLVKLHVYS